MANTIFHLAFSASAASDGGGVRVRCGLQSVELRPSLSNAANKALLESLTGIGSGNVDLTGDWVNGGGHGLDITLKGDFANSNAPLLGFESTLGATSVSLTRGTTSVWYQFPAASMGMPFTENSVFVDESAPDAGDGTPENLTCIIPKITTPGATFIISNGSGATDPLTFAAHNAGAMEAAGITAMLGNWSTGGVVDNGNGTLTVTLEYNAVLDSTLGVGGFVAPDQQSSPGEIECNLLTLTVINATSGSGSLYDAGNNIGLTFADDVTPSDLGQAMIDASFTALPVNSDLSTVSVVGTTRRRTFSIPVAASLTAGLLPVAALNSLDGGSTINATASVSQVGSIATLSPSTPAVLGGGNNDYWRSGRP
jgi:hypothetical protein